MPEEDSALQYQKTLYHPKMQYDIRYYRKHAPRSRIFGNCLRDYSYRGANSHAKRSMLPPLEEDHTGNVPQHPVCSRDTSRVSGSSTLEPQGHRAVKNIHAPDNSDESNSNRIFSSSSVASFKRDQISKLLTSPGMTVQETCEPASPFDDPLLIILGP